nr:MAG: putative capsid protein [Enontekio toti-like virus 4]
MENTMNKKGLSLPAAALSHSNDELRRDGAGGEGVGNHGGNYLAGVLSGVQSGSVSKEKPCRRYYASLTTTAVLQDIPEVVTSSIVYHTQKLHANTEAFRALPDLTRNRPVECAVRAPDYVANDFCGYARRWANFSGDFSVFDLAGIVERLAEGLAFYSMHGSLSSKDLRGGRAPLIAAIGAQTPPITASRSHVFLPRCADAVTSPNVFVAILCAATYCGATLITDLLHVGADNTAETPEATNSSLAEGIYHALRIIGSNYEVSDAGDVFAYAVTRGIHKAVTVISHTDEGGLMRDTLRRSGFTTPFGGISTALREYTGLPIPRSFKPSAVAGLVDSIALATAGATAACDPLSVVDGRYFPTIVACDYQTPTETPGDEEKHVTSGVGWTESMYESNLNQFVNAGADFSPIYIRALGHIFGVKTDSKRAVTHLMACFQSMMCYRGRHIRHQTLAPFFWVEPTSICTLPRADFLAVAQGYAQLAEPGEKNTMPLCEHGTVMGDRDGLVGVGMQWRSARTSGFLLHLTRSSRNGLANMILRQADPDGFALIGGTNPDVMSRMRAGADLQSLLWVRGFAGLPAPAEAVYTSGNIAILVQNTAVNDMTFEVTARHTFLGEELVGGEVAIRVSRPSALNNAVHTDDYSPIVRERTVAAKALVAARRGRGAALVSDVLKLSFRAPGLNFPTPPPKITTTLDEDVRAAVDGTMEQLVMEQVTPTEPFTATKILSAGQRLGHFRGNQLPVRIVQAPQAGPRAGTVAGHTSTRTLVTPTEAAQAPADDVELYPLRSVDISEVRSNAPSPANTEGAEAL